MLSGTAKAVARTALAVLVFNNVRNATAKAVGKAALAVRRGEQTLEAFIVPLKQYDLTALAVLLLSIYMLLKT